jgi:hypothetical protein
VERRTVTPKGALLMEQLREADPELERLLDEGEEIEHRMRHGGRLYVSCGRCGVEIANQMEVIVRFEQYRAMLQQRYLR